MRKKKKGIKYTQNRYSRVGPEGFFSINYERKVYNLNLYHKEEIAEIVDKFLNVLELKKITKAVIIGLGSPVHNIVSSEQWYLFSQLADKLNIDISLSQIIEPNINEEDVKFFKSFGVTSFSKPFDAGFLQYNDTNIQKSLDWLKDYVPNTDQIDTLFIAFHPPLLVALGLVEWNLDHPNVKLISNSLEGYILHDDHFVRAKARYLKKFVTEKSLDVSFSENGFANTIAYLSLYQINK